MVSQTTVSSVRIPFAPPGWPTRCFLPANFLALSPISLAVSTLGSVLVNARITLSFSEGTISLRTAGLRQFSTVLGIRLFRVTYEFE